MFAKVYHTNKENWSCLIVEWEINTNKLNLCHAEIDKKCHEK